MLFRWLRFFERNPNVLRRFLGRSFLPGCALEGNPIMMNFIKQLRRNKAGQDLIEYALLAGFIAVACAALMVPITAQISTIFSSLTSALTLSVGQ